MASPLEQFAIQNVSAPLFSIGGHPIAVTNSAIFMMASVVVSAGLLYAGASKGSMVPGRIQAMSELFYDFIANMIRDNVGSAGKKFFPFIFTLFVFTLFGNILGMLPYGFTFTSHIAVTFAMALAIFVGITAIGTPAISYKWIKNGTDSVGNMDTLTFASIQASDSGSYKCVVTNVAGADTSDPIRLTVILPPVITYSTPVAIYKRDTIAIPNTIVSTGGPVSVFHINPALPTGLSFDTLTGTISGTPDGQSNPANYQVIGSGRGGTDTAMVNISVYTPPTSLSYPDDYVTYVLNVPFVANVPTVNALVTHYSISPALPLASLTIATGTTSSPRVRGWKSSSASSTWGTTSCGTVSSSARGTC